MMGRAKGEGMEVIDASTRMKYVMNVWVAAYPKVV
jgi:hypothetical protein